MFEKLASIKPDLVRIVVTVVASILIFAHILRPEIKIDSVTVALFVVALMPWVSSFIDTASLPGGWKLSFRKIEKTIEEQEEVIAQQRKIIDDLVVFKMAWFLFDLLKGIYYAQKKNEEYPFSKDKDHIKNLTFLRDNGYIEIIGIRKLSDNDNLARLIKLTPIGSAYVEIRERRERELKEEKNT
jgi:hypothetical protein